ncbi:hypothetical protein FACS18945_3400 [Bacteroidia bacterium]|nr:hypothetical protein FACS18945_3400 [Bacteroidia bacterium]
MPESFVAEDIQTTTFKLRTYKKLTDSKTIVKIYIEGDGHSFDGWGNPTSNPTPISNSMRALAFNDLCPNVTYIGRPCQFVKDPICSPHDWTDARFSKEAVDASADAIKEIANGRPVILISYSGGAQIAGLLAVLHPEIKVKKLITIAGNLDHPGWAKMNQLEPLRGSLDLNDYKDKYLQFSQTHFVAENDEVIPPILTKSFVKEVIIVPNATHGNILNAVNGEFSSCD